MRPTLDAGGLKWATCSLGNAWSPRPTVSTLPAAPHPGGRRHARPPLASHRPAHHCALPPFTALPSLPIPYSTAAASHGNAHPSPRRPVQPPITPPYRQYATCERNLRIAGTTAMSRLIRRAPPSPSGTIARLLPSNYNGLFFRSNYQYLL